MTNTTGTLTTNKAERNSINSEFSHDLVDEAYESLSLALNYLEADERSLIKDACHFGDVAHIQDKRKSGEPYITHPFAVAEILAGFHIEKDTIIAAILHDTVEDTDVTFDDISIRYGNKVAELVDGVTKLKSSQHNKQQNKAATFHKILLSTLEDPRVLLIKLSDRLHNMSTLDAVKPEKQRSTAKETLGFYIPFARIMGMNNIANFIELLCYRNLDPKMYVKFSDKLLQHGLGRNIRNNEIHQYLQGLLNRKKLLGHIITLDHKVAMYRQFFSNKRSASMILREYAFEMVLDDIDSCRAIARYLQEKYKIPDNQISDNIKNPLPGGNQSLSMSYHYNNDTIFLTILTKQMCETSKLGVISANNGSTVSQTVIQASLTNMKALVAENIRNISTTNNNTSDADREISTAVSTIDELIHYLHSHKMLCYSPNGKAYELPIGATALDFAYAVGPFVGNVAISAKVDGVACDLASVVSNGQQVEIIIDKNSVPKAEWLGYVCTSKAREIISKWINELPDADKIHHGRQALERALQTYDKHISDLTDADWTDLLTWRKLKSHDKLYQEISSTRLLPQLVVSRLFSDEIKNKLDDEGNTKLPQNLLLANLPGLEISFPKCCNPIYGDTIIGYNSSKHGLVVHRHECEQLKEIRESFANRVFRLNWQDEDKLAVDKERKLFEQANFMAYLKLDIILSEQQVSETISCLKTLDIGVEKIQVIKTTTTLYVVVKSLQHLTSGIKALRNLLGFANVERLYQPQHIQEKNEKS